MLRNCLILIIVIALVTMSCDYRSRSNPFDPENETTGGKPTGLSVTSSLDTAALSWPEMDVKDLTAFAVYRSDSLHPEINQIATIPATQRQFSDAGLTYETTYSYQISALANNFESKLSDPVTITPGPTFKWVLEFATGNIFKLSHDCLHVVFLLNYNGYPDKIAVNSSDGTAWIFDDFSNRIFHVNQSGRLLQILENYNRILDMETDSHENGLWLIDGQNSRVVKLNAVGKEVLTFTNLQRPTCLTVASQTGTCWFVDSDAGRIFSFELDGTVEKRIDFSFLGVSSIALNETSETLWLADSLRLLKIQAQQVQQVADFKFLEVAVDPADGSCWAVGRTLVAKFSANGNLEFSKEGFFYVPSISVNPYDKTCLLTEYYSAQLLQIAEDGQTIQNFKTVQYPSAVAVEYRTSK